MKQKVETKSSTARNSSASQCARGTRRDSPIIKTNGVISAHCTINRAAVICPTGTLVDASLAATSRRGAVTQNPSIRATPARMRSVDGEAEEVLVMAIA